MPDSHPNEGPFRVAQVVLACAELDPTLRFFVERLGFRLDVISPADDPRRAVISGHGLQIELRRSEQRSPGTLRLLCEDPQAYGGGATEIVAPNGTRIELGLATPPLQIPPLQPEFVVTRADAGPAWVSGRAGMHYRDLIPSRLGGRFIASHIRIDDGGPVPDYVHFHAIRFQLIFCVRGWVRLVYEDQGPAFVMQPGDCVLQPPAIRHRVLECSPGLEVVEVTCPAEHDTFADHELELPTKEKCPDRDFGGQRFVLHVANAASWHAGPLPGFEHRDTGIARATNGLASAVVVRLSEPRPAPSWQPAGELLFLYVLSGSMTLHCNGRPPETLTSDDSAVVPAELETSLSADSPDLEWLEVRLPAPGQA